MELRNSFDDAKLFGPLRATGELAVWSVAVRREACRVNGHEKARRGTKKSSCDFSCLFVASFCWSLSSTSSTPRFYQIVNRRKVPIIGHPA
jgi:hypothetical protein